MHGWRLDLVGRRPGIVFSLQFSFCPSNLYPGESTGRALKSASGAPRASSWGGGLHLEDDNDNAEAEASIKQKADEKDQGKGGKVSQKTDIKSILHFSFISFIISVFNSEVTMLVIFLACAHTFAPCLRSAKPLRRRPRRSTSG